MSGSVAHNGTVASSFVEVPAVPGQVAPIDDERELLLAYVAQQRDGIKYAAFGLTDEQARATPTAGTLSVGGLVKHVTAMERTWLGLVRGDQTGDATDYLDGFTLRDDETLAGALSALDATAAETEATIRRTELDARVAVPKGVPWFPDDVESWSVRWVLLHLVEEIARHAGHADIVRESIDGATMHPLMAAVEGWPATEWLQPWAPA